MAEPPRDWNVLGMIKWGEAYFTEKDVPSPRLSIEWLLAEVLAIKRLDLYLQFDRPLSAGELQQIKPLVKRRASHEPLQYITGSTDFFGLPMHVNHHVLIPRPETEQLCEKILETFKDAQNLKVLDIGTGSGCIPIALKHHKPGWQVSACDISSEALQVARENAELNRCDITFFQADLYRLQPGQLPFIPDVLVSNPPYIPPDEFSSLEQQVREFEPELALKTENPEATFTALIRFSDEVLTGNGQFYFETGADQNELVSLADPALWKVEYHKDYEGRGRILVGTRKG